MAQIDPTNVSSSYLAEVLGMARDAVSKLYAAGVIKQNGIARGKYNLADAVPAYSKYLRDNKGSDVSTRLKQQQTRKLEIQNDKTESVLVKTEDAAQAYRASCMYWRCLMAELPKRLAPQIAKTNDPEKIRELLRDGLNGICTTFEKGLNQAIQGATDEAQN